MRSTRSGTEAAPVDDRVTWLPRAVPPVLPGPVASPLAMGASSATGESPSRPGRCHGECGASSIASVFGVAIFLGFMLLSTQVLVHLYASSTVSAVAFDTARRASGLGGDCDTSAVNARTRLGTWGAQPGVDIRCDATADGRIEVIISGPSPARGLSIFGTGLIDRIERGASFRHELEIGP